MSSQLLGGRPVVLFTAVTPHGRVVTAKLVREGGHVTLSWTVDSMLEGVEDFSDPLAALKRAQRLRREVGDEAALPA